MSDWVTWADYLNEEMARQGEAAADVVFCSPDLHRLHQPFRYFGEPTQGFTLWTARRVYFPSIYDGYCGVVSVPRAPCPEEVLHVNGSQYEAERAYTPPTPPTEEELAAEREAEAERNAAKAENAARLKHEWLERALKKLDEDE